MPKKSAGILLYRLEDNLPEVLLVHPGGPFWTKKDLGAWSIPKGELEENEDPLNAAKRETEEELGTKVAGEFLELTPVKQKGGKMILAWALLQDLDPSKISSNNFEMEWPPKSGNRKSFPEIDKAAWLNMNDARKKINPGQAGLLDDLERMLEERRRAG
jgi:predicted NUDIX family NTP pyrophosphohydrolase